MQTNNYVTKTMHGDVVEKGVQKVMLNASIRPGRSLQISVEVLDADYVKANETDVQAAVAEFVLNACEQAASDGIPTKVTGKT